jgi:hypothetical protein
VTQYGDAFSPRNGRCKVAHWWSGGVMVHCDNVDGVPGGHVDSFQLNFVA